MLPPLGKRAGRLTGGKATLFLVCLATPVVDAKMVEVFVYVGWGTTNTSWHIDTIVFIGVSSLVPMQATPIFYSVVV